MLKNNDNSLKVNPKGLKHPSNPNCGYDTLITLKLHVYQLFVDVLVCGDPSNKCMTF